jgi:hypothetical protein
VDEVQQAQAFVGVDCDIESKTIEDYTPKTKTRLSRISNKSLRELHEQPNSFFMSQFPVPPRANNIAVGI